MAASRLASFRRCAIFLAVSVSCLCSSAADEPSPPTERHLMTLRGHSGKIRGVAYSPDGKRLASGGFDAAIKVWQATTGKLVLTLEGHDRVVNSVAFSPAIKGDQRGQVHIFWPRYGEIRLMYSSPP